MKILKELKVAPCPRTKAKTCECEEVNTITEAEGFISAKCELEQSDTVKGMFALTLFDLKKNCIYFSRAFSKIIIT